jgi:hypothetical protein
MMRRMAMDPGADAQDAFDTACVMAECGPGFEPDRGFVAAAARTWRSFDSFAHAAHSCRWLWPMAWRHCQGLDPAERPGFLALELEVVMVWVLQFDWRPDTNQVRAGWAAIRKAMNKRQAVDLCWPIPFEQVTCGRLLATPLASGWELFEEGRQMHHCVHDLVDACAAGTLLVLSVTDQGGRRVATMSFEQDADGSWVLDQCQGVANAKVTHADIEGLMQRVADRLGEAGDLTK